MLGHWTYTFFHKPCPERFKHHLDFEVKVALAADIAAAAQTAHIGYTQDTRRCPVQCPGQQIPYYWALAGGSVGKVSPVVYGGAPMGEVNSANIIQLHPLAAGAARAVPCLIPIIVQI